MRQSFSKTQRVIHGDDFTMILRRGVCVADGVLVLFAVATADDRLPRLGITIPKKTGNAVARNRWKRLIRESYRTQQESIPNGIDFIVRPKKGAKPDWKSIKKSVPKLAAKAAKKLANG
ncbi:MAG: ribonuclease P protein component [Pirellulaceae bacterium]